MGCTPALGAYLGFTLGVRLARGVFQHRKSRVGLDFVGGDELLVLSRPCHRLLFSPVLHKTLSARTQSAIQINSTTRPRTNVSSSWFGEPPIVKYVVQYRFCTSAVWITVSLSASNQFPPMSLGVKGHEAGLMHYSPRARVPTAPMRTALAPVARIYAKSTGSNGFRIDRRARLRLHRWGQNRTGRLGRVFVNILGAR